MKQLGDGILATFDGPARAVRCAAALLDAAQDQGITLRAGLHTGEIELRASDVAGIAVHIASRIAASPTRTRSSSRAPSSTSPPDPAWSSSRAVNTNSKVFPAPGQRSPPKRVPRPRQICRSALARSRRIGHSVRARWLSGHSETVNCALMPFWKWLIGGSLSSSTTLQNST